MNYRRLGATEIRISEIGLGCQSLGGGLYYRSKRESIAVVHLALDAGVNFFDTSDHYSQGLSEEWLGEALKGRRARAVVATKAGTRYTPLGAAAGQLRPLLRPIGSQLRPLKLAFHRMRASQKRQDFSAGYLRRAVEASLRRLNTDYLDLFQLHKPPANELRSAEWLETVDRLQDEGKIRSYGISCANVDDARMCLERPSLASVQIGLSLLELHGLPQFLDQARARSISVIARNPRAQGYLTKEFGDIMAESYASSKAEARTRRERAMQFSFLANERRTLAQSALQFVLGRPGVTSAIPRAVNISHMSENLGALTAPPISAEEMRTVLDLFEQHANEGK